MDNQEFNEGNQEKWWEVLLGVVVIMAILATFWFYLLIF